MSEGARGARTVQEERQAFEEAVDELVAAGQEGKYVLFKDGRVQGFFSSEREAREAGLDRFGLGSFLVDLVVPRRTNWRPPFFRSNEPA